MHAPAFPLYRRLSDGHRWYRVASPQAMTEVERLGRRFVRHELRAQQYPELQRIAEVITALPPHYLPCSEEEFLGVLDRCSE